MRKKTVLWLALPIMAAYGFIARPWTCQPWLYTLRNYFSCETTVVNSIQVTEGRVEATTRTLLWCTPAGAVSVTDS